MADDYRGQASLPRGIRNNNPGNIKVGDNWQGMASNDGTFIIFADMSWGVRAIGTSLVNMIQKGYDTIDTLIRQWSATDQDAYVANVSAATGIDPSTQLGTDSDTITSLIQAIVDQENGTGASYVTAEDIAEGVQKINSPFFTMAQAVVVDAANQPIPYLIGGIVLFFGIYLFSRKSRRR